MSGTEVHPELKRAAANETAAAAPAARGAVPPAAAAGAPRRCMPNGDPPSEMLWGTSDPEAGRLIRVA